MKKILLLLIVFLCAFSFASCADGETSAKIETAKAGKINVGVFSKSEVEKGKAALTPTLSVPTESILDDGKGLYSLSLQKEGEGEVSLSETKAQAGSTVVVTALPAEYWAFEYLTVNDVRQEGKSFVMPEKDARVVVFFRDTRHQVYYDPNAVRLAKSDPTIVEGERCYFSISLSDDSRDFEDEDVFCRSERAVYGDYTYYDVRKESDGSFSFVAPDGDCRVGLRATHERAYIQEWNAYLVEGETTWLQDPALYASISFSIGGEPFSFRKYFSRGTLTATVEPIDRYRVQKIEISGWREGGEMTKKDDAHYTFELNGAYEYLSIYLEPLPKPENAHLTTCESSDKGRISVSGEWAVEGSAVEVTVEPNEGCRLFSLVYKYQTGLGERKENISFENGAYSFEMPAADVSIEALFLAENEIACLLNVSVDGEPVSLTDVVTRIRKYIDTRPISEIEVKNDLVLVFEVGQYIQLDLSFDRRYSNHAIYLNGALIPVAISSNNYSITFDVPQEDLEILVELG